MTNPKDYFAGHAHSCDVGIACAVGLEAAHVFNHIVYWLKNNAAKNKSKIINGRHWMYETQKEISDCLGYLSEDQVCRAIKKLVDFGLILAENHHEDKFKKTNWYAIFDDQIYLKDLGNKKMFTKPRNRGIVDEQEIPRENASTDDFQRSAKSRNGNRESAECIYKEQEDKLHNNKTTTTRASAPDDVDLFFTDQEREQLNNYTPEQIDEATRITIRDCVQKKNGTRVKFFFSTIENNSNSHEE
jgi:hypothetical protein